MPYLLNKSHSSAVRPPLTSLDAAPSKSKVTTHLNTALTTYAAIEFLAVACSAYFIGILYHGIFLNSWLTGAEHILAAVFIATLVTLTSIGLRSGPNCPFQLTDDHARLGADVVRYSVIGSDLHRLPVTGPQRTAKNSGHYPIGPLFERFLLHFMRAI
jgi:hypothetical protein